MFKSGWTVAGLGVLFVIIQSCGDDLGTGRIMTPGATGEMLPATETTQPVAPTPEPAQPQAEVPPAELAPVARDEQGWPEYQYDDGSEMWDGGAAIELEEWHWNQGVAQYRRQNGQRFTMNCIARGSEYAVWGTNPYTDDSPVCMAGAHLGLIKREEGGRVTIEIRPAQRSFKGGDANGVTAFPWGPYPGSYRVIR